MVDPLLSELELVDPSFKPLISNVDPEVSSQFERARLRFNANLEIAKLDGAHGVAAMIERAKKCMCSLDTTGTFFIELRFLQSMSGACGETRLVKLVLACFLDEKSLFLHG